MPLYSLSYELTQQKETTIEAKNPDQAAKKLLEYLNREYSQVGIPLDHAPSINIYKVKVVE